MDLHSLMNMHVVYYILATALVLIGLVGTILPVLPGLPLMLDAFLSRPARITLMPSDLLP